MHYLHILDLMILKYISSLIIVVNYLSTFISMLKLQFIYYSFEIYTKKSTGSYFIRLWLKHNFYDELRQVISKGSFVILLLAKSSY